MPNRPQPFSPMMLSTSTSTPRGSSILTSPGHSTTTPSVFRLDPQSQLPQQNVEWNPSQAYVDLQRACQILTERGFKLAAKWAAEQWMGLPAVDHMQLPPCSIPVEYCNDASASSSSPLYCYAKTLMDLSEYAHAAAVLSQAASSGGDETGITTTVETMPPPLPDLSPAAVGLRAYALYMAGEQRKEEEFHERNNPENQGSGNTPGTGGTTSRNPR